MIVIGLVLALTLAATKLLPAIARYYNNRGVRLQQQGNLQAAIENYRHACILQTGYAEPHYNLGDVFEELPNYSQALEEYQRAIDIDSTFYPAYNNLSRLYILRLKDYGAALRLLDHAFGLQPKELSVQYSLNKNYGWANLELHNFRQAEANLRKAVELQSNGGGAHCLLARVLESEDNPAGAEKEWEACVAYSTQPEVEPEWRNQAQDRVRKEVFK